MRNTPLNPIIANNAHPNVDNSSIIEGLVVLFILCVGKDVTVADCADEEVTVADCADEEVTVADCADSGPPNSSGLLKYLLRQS
jgi:hypothetical protein